MVDGWGLHNPYGVRILNPLEIIGRSLKVSLNIIYLILIYIVLNYTVIWLHALEGLLEMIKLEFSWIKSLKKCRFGQIWADRN